MRLVMSLARDSRCPAEMVIIEDPFFLPSCSWKTRLTTGFPASCIIVRTASFTGSWRETRAIKIEDEYSLNRRRGSSKSNSGSWDLMELKGPPTDLGEPGGSQRKLGGPQRELRGPGDDRKNEVIP